jgi:membrane associated rhomboid family serine protease
MNTRTRFAFGVGLVVVSSIVVIASLVFLLIGQGSDVNVATAISGLCSGVVGTVTAIGARRSVKGTNPDR